MEGPLFELDSNKCWRAKMRSPFESTPRPLLKSDLRPLFRYGIIERLEQVCLPSDPRLEWSGDGPLFELDLNKCFRGRGECGHFSSHLLGHYLRQAWGT